MSRNFQSEQTADRRIIFKDGDGNTIAEQNDNVLHSGRYVERPDTQRVIPVAGFRSPTGWQVRDDTRAFGYTGKITYNSWGTFVTYDGSTSGSWAPEHPTPTLHSVNEISRAEVQTLLKVKDQKMNAAVALAESRKTIEMIADRTMKLVRAYSSVKKGDMSGALRVLGYTSGKKRAPKPSGKGPASDWLEIQYGWLPLLSDIHGGYELARQKYNTFGYVVSAKSVVRTKTKRSREGSEDGSGFIQTSNDVLEQLTKVALSYRVDSNALRAATSAGLLNPATVAWELLPFSFLFDWLVPVGNWIEALDATAGLTFLGGTCTQTCRVTRKGVLSGGKSGKATGQATSFAQSFRMVRTVYGSSPIPTPYYKNPFSTGHALNALALVRTIFGK